MPLDSPPPATVRLVPLGGLGEVGMNCMVLEQGGDTIVVDCGIRFPHDDLGVDVVHPDFSWLAERADRIRGVFLTHGHEDHIGALPYLLGALETAAPVYGPAHAIALVEKRMLEHGFGATSSDLRVVTPGKRTALGSFEIEPIRVAHSIVEASALAIETAAGCVVHTGDFNFDSDPPDGEPTDERRLEALGDRGVALLLSDSTNVDVPREGGSERDVGVALESLVRSTRERVIVALFASNVQRLILLGEIARRTSRKICVLGRSLDRQIEVATAIGRLRWPSLLRVAPSDVRHLSRDGVMILAGGTQGEPNSALARLAGGTHPDLAIEAGDLVVLSSRIIPGNDVGVYGMTDALLRRGARVHSRITDGGIHTSGHATRPEQERMLDLVRPRCFLPVHGTRHHLERHAALARAQGVTDILVAENGTSVLCDGTRLFEEARVPSGRVSVGFGGVRLSEEVLKERTDVARTGVATVAVALDRKGSVVGTPSVVLRGIGGADDIAVRRVKGQVVETLERLRRRKASAETVREELRRVVRRALVDVGGVRPVVDVHLIEE